MKIELVEKETDHRELLPQIVDRIFAVCRNDPNFHLKDEMEIVENRMESLRQKIAKQIELLEQSNMLSKDLMQRIDIIENQNDDSQMKLLESLGSDI